MAFTVGKAIALPLKIMSNCESIPIILRTANITIGRPSGGLAIAINNKFAASLLDQNDIYIAVEL